ncbi:unnamed protein product [Psylliodes chrysocephalus]|uniref:Lipase domain-containing protein n=1 Tax=Psylliodes chrysocephalus TaxID=3402493 RepID=A0A9P0CRG7_9CUCU|nr:unnamed protein product [Psylliodes chrysocephala]
MKIIVLLFSLITFCQSSPVVLYREVAPGEWEPEIVTNSLSGYNISEDDVKIYFTSQSHQGNLKRVNLNNPIEVNNDGYSNEKDTVFIIHGWQNEHKSPICEEITEAVLKVKDANVFVVDWKNVAKQVYPLAQAAVDDVAKTVSRLIVSLINYNALDLNKTFIVGHSLGAHVAGFCGANLKGKINHIVGLDPALPLYELANKDARLDPSDAQFVQVIHSCAGVLGFNRNIGHVDYWPNGGSNQPGCGGLLDVGGACSHARSYYYFAESIVSGGFLSHKCDSYRHFKQGKCKSKPTSFMGGYDLDKQSNGTYYLLTGSEPPFAKN